MASEFDDIAGRVLERIGLSAKEPVDVRLVARKLGITSIIETEMLEAGRLELEGGEPRILIKRGVAPARTNFTIAHELGHLMLTTKTEGIAGRRLVGYDREERWCDQFAASLLLPRQWVLSAAARRPQTLRTVEALANHSHASLSAVVLRLRQVCGWNQTLLRWRRFDGRWVWVGGVGVPTHMRSLESLEATTRRLQAMRLNSRRVFTDLPMGLGESKTLLLRGEASRRGASVVMLCSLTG